jgi:hypothetical protein
MAFTVTGINDLSTSDVIWDDATGETVAQAFARFSTFGPLMGALSAIDYLTRNPGADMMSFGYGDDPVDFDSIGLEELTENVEELGADAVDAEWGPFAPWL